MAGNVNNVYLCPYSDLWASCPIYLCRDMEILGFQYKIRSFRVLIYLYICKFLSFRLSRKQASFFLAFPIKSCTLVYFVSKDNLLVRKSYKKYQCIKLIGLAPWEKAYREIRPFSSHNGSDWRELRPLVTPWTWPIKQGIEPWKCEIGFSCLMSKLPHHAPGVSVARSLALLAHLSHDQWTQLGERFFANWLRPAQQLPPRAG